MTRVSVGTFQGDVGVAVRGPRGGASACPLDPAHADPLRIGFPRGYPVAQLLAAAGDEALASWARRALLQAAGLAAASPPRRPASRRPAPPKVVEVRLSRDEYAELRRRIGGRRVLAWAREALRAAAGCPGRWSDDARAELCATFRRVGVDALLRRFPGRTPRGIEDQARRLGLSSALDDTRLTVTQAEACTGYDRRQLRRMFAAEGVEVARPVGRGRGTRGSFVRRDDVRRACESVCGSETLAAAAARLAMHPKTLMRRLRVAGLYGAYGRGRRPAFARAEVDAALARLAAAS